MNRGSVETKLEKAQLLVESELGTVEEQLTAAHECILLLFSLDRRSFSSGNRGEEGD